MRRSPLWLASLALLIPAPASAHVLSAGAHHWWEGEPATFPVTADHCLLGVQRIGEGATWEVLSQHVLDAHQVYEAGGRENCGAAWSRPKGWMAQRVALWRWIEARREWGICKDSGEIHSSRVTSNMTFTRYYVAAPCGEGFYTTTAGGFVKDSSGWHGRWISHDEHHYAYA